MTHLSSQKKTKTWVDSNPLTWILQYVSFDNLQKTLLFKVMTRSLLGCRLTWQEDYRFCCNMLGDCGPGCRSVGGSLTLCSLLTPCSLNWIKWGFFLSLVWGLKQAMHFFKGQPRNWYTKDNSVMLLAFLIWGLCEKESRVHEAATTVSSCAHACLLHLFPKMKQNFLLRQGKIQRCFIQATLTAQTGWPVSAWFIS